MSIQNAIRLLEVIDEDNSLRTELYKCDSASDLKTCLQNRQLLFTRDEFEDAVNTLHVKCQEYEDAQHLLQKADWFRFLLLMNENALI
jgi:hypothetical protein